MSNVQIPNLPVAIALNGTEALEAVQSGTSVQTTVAGIAQYSYAYYPGFYISQLPAASSVNSTDIFPVVQGSTGPNTGTTYKATVGQLFTSPTFTGTTTINGSLFFDSSAKDVSSGFNLINYNAYLYGTPPALPYSGFKIGFNDTINAQNNISNYLTVVGRWGGAGTRGLRTGIFSDLGSSAPIDAADTSALNDMVSFTAGNYSTNVVVKSGAYAGNESGGFWLFAGVTRPSSYAIVDFYGSEFDVLATAPPLNKTGLGIVQNTGDSARGKRGDSAIYIGNQVGALTTWRNGLSFGFSNANWAFGSDSSLISIELNASVLGAGPGVPARWGVDFSQAAFTTNGGLLRSIGMAVSPIGAIGGQSVYGTTLTTTRDVQAQTASVASVTVVNGGSFPSLPALTIGAPPSGVTATATVTTMGVVGVENINTRGTSGFAVNDIMTLSGGTFATAARVKIIAVEAGLPVDFVVQTTGSYTVLPTSPVTLTGGSGSGTITITPNWTILTVTVGAAGSGYAVYPPPLVTSATATRYRTRMELIPQMTATQAALVLNTGNTTQVDSLIIGSGGPRIVQNTGVPPVILTLPRGTLYLRTDGAVGSTVYVSQGGGTWNAIAGV